MLRCIVAVLREQHIGKAMSGIFLLFAIDAFAGLVDIPFLYRLTHFFNARSREFPMYELSVSGLEITFKSLNVAVFLVLAWMSYRWLARIPEENPGA